MRIREAVCKLRIPIRKIRLQTHIAELQPFPKPNGLKEASFSYNFIRIERKTGKLPHI
jgi:hypothetical protein